MWRPGKTERRQPSLGRDTERRSGRDCKDVGFRSRIYLRVDSLYVCKFSIFSSVV